MPVSAGRLLVTAAGGILLWSGIQGKSVTGVFRAVIGGQSPSTAASANPIDLTSYTYGYGSTATGSGSSAAPGNTGASSPSAASNQALAKMLAISMGHADWTTGAEWADWVSLWNQESGWSTTAVNPSSGATGIPQLLPSVHTVPPNWSSASVQITWGINYIASTYGSPSRAWDHEKANSWY